MCIDRADILGGGLEAAWRLRKQSTGCRGSAGISGEPCEEGHRETDSDVGRDPIGEQRHPSFTPVGGRSNRESLAAEYRMWR